MERFLILVLFLGLAQGYYIFSSDGCEEDHVKCPSQQECIPFTHVCDDEPDCSDNMDELDCPKRREDCGGGNLALCVKRQRNDWEGVYIGPGPHSAVNEAEVEMFAARVAAKLSQLKEEPYLEAERLINSVLYKAQKGRLSQTTVLSTAPHHTYSPHSLPSPTQPANNSLLRVPFNSVLRSQLS